MASEVINADKDIRNSDWIKSAHWDAPFTTLDEFIARRNLTGAAHHTIDLAIRKFMDLPAYAPAPETLKTEFEGFLSGRIVKEWSEDLHPRDAQGRFASGATSDDVAMATLQKIAQYYPGGLDLEKRPSDLKYLFRNDFGLNDSRAALTREYVKAGMGKNNAALQANADLIRAGSYLEQAANEEWYRGQAYANNPDIESAYEPAEREKLIENFNASKEAATDLIENGRVAIAVPSEVFDKVLEDGRFKNQFETKTSGGSTDIGLRKMFESGAVGIPVGTKNADRPIYGFMTSNTTPAAGQNEMSDNPARVWEAIGSINTPAVDHYGEVRVVLTDEARDHTTATIGDSLRNSRIAEPVENPVTDATIRNMGIYDFAGGHAGSFGVPYMPSYNSLRYVETQTRGVTVNDIAEVHVPAAMVEATQSKIEAAGLNIPVIAREVK